MKWIKTRNWIKKRIVVILGMELILRGVDAVDESYPILMKALWSGKE